MPETKKADSVERHFPSEAKSESRAEPRRTLAKASESGDPAVHQLMAARQTAVMNGNEEAAKAATDALAKLGFE